MLAKYTLYGVLYIITACIVASIFFLPSYGGNDYPILRIIIIFFATVLLAKYFLYMFFSPWYDVRLAYQRAQERKQKPTRRNRAPKVSVIIPAWNERVGIKRTVESLAASTHRPLEIIVVNDGSTDGSHSLMKRFVRDFKRDAGVTLLYFYKKNGGKGKALNYGIARSSGDIIVSIDADCVVDQHAIANFVRHFNDPAVSAAVGNVKIGNTKSILGTLQYLEFLFSFYFKKADSLLNTIYIVGGAAGAFRREVFTQVGMYSDHNITEDIDLSVRIQKAGLRIVYAADAIVYTEGAPTMLGLMKQRLRWKRGRFQTFFQHRDLFFSKDDKHNTMLTWVVLPLALFGDTQLFFEVLFLMFLYFTSLMTGDFSSFVSGILVVSSIFLVQMFDDRKTNKASFYVLAPIAWLLFYVTTVVEYHALVKSLWTMITGKAVTWQRWERRGCLDKPISVTVP